MNLATGWVVLGAEREAEEGLHRSLHTLASKGMLPKLREHGGELLVLQRQARGAKKDFVIIETLAQRHLEVLFLHPLGGGDPAR